MKYKLIDEEGFTKHGRNLDAIERHGIKVDGQIYIDIESIDHDGYGFTSCGWCILADSEFKHFEKVEEEEEEDFDRDLTERIYVAMLSREGLGTIPFPKLWERSVEAAKAAK